MIDKQDHEPGLSVLPILSEPMALVIAAGSPLDTGEDEVSAASLADLPLAMPSSRFGLRALAEGALAKTGGRLTPELEVDGLAVALHLVRSGRWGTILPPSALRRQLRRGFLKRRIIVGPKIERQLCIARRADAAFGQAEADLVSWLVDSIRASAAGGDASIEPAPRWS